MPKREIHYSGESEEKYQPKPNEVWETRSNDVLIVEVPEPISVLYHHPEERWRRVAILWYDETDGTFVVSECQNRLQAKKDMTAAQWFQMIQERISARAPDQS